MIINHFKPLIKKLSAACALAFIVFVLFAPVKIAFAAAGSCDPKTTPGCDYLPLTTIPGAFTANTPTDPIKVITNIYGVAIGIAAVLAVGMITWAGIQYATTEAITGKSDAKGHWEGAIWGLVILLGSYIMLRTINVDLVNLNLDLTPITPTTTVGSNALSDLQNMVNLSAKKNAAIYQDNQAQLDAARKNLDSLAGIKAQRDILAEQLKNLDPEAVVTAAERSDLISKISALDKQLNDAKFAVVTTLISTTAAKETQDVNAALLKGDIDGASIIATTKEKAMDEQIQNLKDSGASSDLINTATAQKVSAAALNSQNIFTSQSLLYVNKMLAEKASYLPSGIASASLETINRFAKAQNAQMVELRQNNAPASILSDFQVQSKAQFDILKASLPITQPCASGNYAYSGKSIVCAY
jgi:hypothetical protein